MIAYAVDAAPFKLVGAASATQPSASTNAPNVTRFLQLDIAEDIIMLLCVCVCVCSLTLD